MEANGALSIYPATTISRKRKSDDVALGGPNHSIKSANRKTAIVTEQLRRNLMKCLCAKLESFIPTAPPKVDRCGLYEEAGNYIRKLQDEVCQLKRLRESLRAEQNCGKTVKENAELTKVGVEVYGREIVVIITSISRPRCLWKMTQVVEEHGLDVDMSQLSTGEFFVYIYFHARFIEDMKPDDPAQLKSSLERRLLMAY